MGNPEPSRRTRARVSAEPSVAGISLVVVFRNPHQGGCDGGEKGESRSGDELGGSRICSSREAQMS